MTNIEKRGIQSVLAQVSTGMITGLGIQSYVLGLNAMLNLLNQD
jgi:3-dehydroquinate dehydratase